MDLDESRIVEILYASLGKYVLPNMGRGNRTSSKRTEKGLIHYQ